MRRSTNLQNIREDPGIKGIKICGTEFRISQVADDTSLLFEGDQNSCENLFRTMDDSAKMSGLKLNYDKLIMSVISAMSYFTWDLLCFLTN